MHRGLQTLRRCQDGDNSNSLAREEIDKRGGDGGAGYDGKYHPDRQADIVAPETLIAILNCLLGEKSCVLVREGCSFGSGPGVVFGCYLDYEAGPRKLIVTRAGY
jgi:hypothetical protein